MAPIDTCKFRYFPEITMLPITFIIFLSTILFCCRPLKIKNTEPFPGGDSVLVSRVPENSEHGRVRCDECGQTYSSPHLLVGVVCTLRILRTVSVWNKIGFVSCSVGLLILITSRKTNFISVEAY